MFLAKSVDPSICPDENRIAIACTNLEYQCSTLGLLVTTKLEVLATLQCQLCLRLARCAFQSQHNLLCGLCLLVENGFCLTTITGLFSIITTLSLSEQRSLSSLVLSDLVLGVLSAILAFAVSASGLWDVDLRGRRNVSLD